VSEDATPADKLIGQLKDLADYLEPNDMAGSTICRKAAGFIAHRLAAAKAMQGDEAVERAAKAISDCLDLRFAHMTGREMVNDGTIAAGLARAALNQKETP